MKHDLSLMIAVVGAIGLTLGVLIGRRFFDPIFLKSPQQARRAHAAQPLFIAIAWALCLAIRFSIALR